MNNKFQIDNWQLKIENYLIVVFALINLQIPIYGAICTFITRMHFRQMHKPSSLFVGNGLVPFRLQALSLSASNYSLSLCLQYCIWRGGRPCPPGVGTFDVVKAVINRRGLQTCGSLWRGSSRRVRERKACDLYDFTINSTVFRFFSLLPPSAPPSSEGGTNLEVPTFYNTTPLHRWCKHGRTGTSAATKSRQ